MNHHLSDHNSIIFNLNYEKVKTGKGKQRNNQYYTSIPDYNFIDADDEDWYRMNLELNKINWVSLLGDNAPEPMTDLFLNKLLETVQLIFDKSQKSESAEDVKKFSNNNKIPRNIRILMRRKGKLSKSIQKVKSIPKYIKLTNKLESIEKELSLSYSKRRNKLEREALGRIKKDPGAFYRYAKKFSRSYCDIGPFINKKGDVVNDGSEIVHMLKEQYESVFSSPIESKQVDDSSVFFSTNHAANKLENLFISQADVVEALESLGSRSSAGPDGVPSILLKKCKEGLAEPLMILFRNYLESGVIPSSMKHAFIVPVHKGGTRSVPENFRPVSLTSHIIKTMERIIRKYLVGHLECFEKLNPSQHGFRNRRSCLTQLLEHQDKVLKLLEEGMNVDSIYLDFSRAFDKVDIGILCHKLKEMGISGKLGRWLHSFLTERKQFVIANGIKSQESEVLSGVPQGTVLGPTLFLILINDINYNVDSEVSLFADDTRVLKGVQSTEDTDELQKDLEKLYCWQKENNMLFNGKKFEMLRYGKDSDLKESTQYLTPEGESAN